DAQLTRNGAAANPRSPADCRSAKMPVDKARQSLAREIAHVRRRRGRPHDRTKIIDLAVELIEREIGFESLDAVAGGETAGIPFAAWIADRLSLPMLYVRKKPKGFGRGAQIEGNMEPGCRSLLVEDLATDGGSKVNFVNAIRDGEGQVKDA